MEAKSSKYLDQKKNAETGGNLANYTLTDECIHFLKKLFAEF
jgi:hypothetical protein